MSKYSAELIRIISDIEELFCLNSNIVSGTPLVQQSIDEVLDFSLQEAQSLPAEALKALNVSVSRKVVLLSYTNARMKFFGKKEIDFSNMPCLYEVATVLLQYTSKKSITQDALDSIDKCVLVLESMESHGSSCVKDTISYRILRVFILCVLYGLLCNAGILADLIISQMIVKGVQ